MVRLDAVLGVRPAPVAMPRPPQVASPSVPVDAYLAGAPAPADFWAEAARAGLFAAGAAAASPVSATMTAASVQALVDDMLARGVRFYHSEGNRSGSSHSRFFPDQAAKAILDSTPRQLPEGFTMQADGMDDFAPVRTLDDLRVVDALYSGTPTSTPLAADLQSLVGKVTFSESAVSFPRRVGAFGVHQALAAGASGAWRTERGVVASSADIHALAFFEAGGEADGLPDPERARVLRDLERDGLTFHAGDVTRPLSAYEVWRTPPERLHVGAWGVAWEAADPSLSRSPMLSPALDILRRFHRSLAADGVPSDEIATLVKGATGTPITSSPPQPEPPAVSFPPFGWPNVPAKPRPAGPPPPPAQVPPPEILTQRCESLSSLRQAQARWGREQGTAAERAVDDATWLEGQKTSSEAYRDLLARLPQEDARKTLLEADARVRTLALLLGRHAVAIEAARLDAASQALLEPAVALESSLSPAAPPVQRTDAIARHAFADVLLALEHRQPGQSLEEAFELLSDVHRALALRVPWDGRAAVYARTMEELQTGMLRGRKPREAVHEVVAGIVLTGSIEAAIDRVVQEPGHIEAGKDEVVIGGIRVPVKRLLFTNLPGLYLIDDASLLDSPLPHPNYRTP